GESRFSGEQPYSSQDIARDRAHQRDLTSLREVLQAPTPPVPTFAPARYGGQAARVLRPAACGQRPAAPTHPAAPPSDPAVTPAAPAGRTQSPRSPGTRTPLPRTSPDPSAPRRRASSGACR